MLAFPVFMKRENLNSVITIFKGGMYNAYFPKIFFMVK